MAAFRQVGKGRATGRLRAAVMGLLLCAAAVPAPALAEGEGFFISVGGKAVSGDARLARNRAPVARAASVFADVTVVADGLGMRPSLGLEVLSLADGQARVQSRTNYPAWIAGAELRLMRLSPGRPAQLVQRLALAPNGQATVALPPVAAEETLALVYRVSDRQGRYDETRPVPLAALGIEEADEGRDAAAVRNIPVAGGAVTVSGRNLTPGQRVSTLGETVSADSSGAFVLQRLLPAGTHAVAVTVGGQAMPRQVVTIPQTEWFGTGLADFTFGRNLVGAEAGRGWDRGRLAYYVTGKTAEGWQITSSADTGETPVADLFRDLDRKDPLGLVERLAPDMGYPTYGDDAELRIDAPTGGKFYFKAAREGSHFLWGNFKGRLGGSAYVRNERALYGAQAVWRELAVTARGEPRASLAAHAALPSQLPGRDVYLGTGGSVYFLTRQDIAIGSETLSIELRDPVSGRVADRRNLVAGRDYVINYLQGSVMLTAPLAGLSAGSFAGVPAAGEALQSRLVVQYEYTPLAGDVQGMVLGGRAEAWLGDDLRLGVSATRDQTNIADQTAAAVDLLWKIGAGSQVALDLARSEGPGFGYSTSGDGGLTVTAAGPWGGTGTAARIAADLELGDLGLARQGRLALWNEERKAGFTSLDHRVTADETDRGVRIELRPRPDLTLRLGAEDYASAAGSWRRKADMGLVWAPQDRAVAWAFGLTQEDRNEPGQPSRTGMRSDATIRATITASEALSWYVFGQGTLAHGGGRPRNDRIGIGATYGFGQGWKAEGEISTGTAGPGARALLRRDQPGRRVWIGYTLDPGRELQGVTLNGRDQGQLIVGAEQALSDSVTVTGENSYDMFGAHRALVSRYGVEYRATEALAFSSALEIGRIEDPVMGNFDRTALSLGLRFGAGEGRSARARLELRQDRGTQGGGPVDSRTLALSGDAEWRLDPAARLLAGLQATRTVGGTASVQEGSYLKASFGYAYRPVQDDRLNLLLRYTVLHDLYGQRVNGTVSRGPRQRSQVVSADLSYDLDSRWTLGAKAGLRLGETAPDAASDFARNDAALLVLNARYHLTHRWDLLVEGRQLRGFQAGTTDSGFLASASRRVGDHLMLGVGYNFGRFSSDLTDLVADDAGIFVNITGSF